MGINYCYSDYVINNWDGLKSRYIATATGSEIDKMCKKSQHREIGRTDDERAAGERHLIYFCDGAGSDGLSKSYLISKDDTLGKR